MVGFGRIFCVTAEIRAELLEGLMVACGNETWRIGSPGGDEADGTNSGRKKIAGDDAATTAMEDILMSVLSSVLVPFASSGCEETSHNILAGAIFGAAMNVDGGTIIRQLWVWDPRSLTKKENTIVPEEKPHGLSSNDDFEIKELTSSSVPNHEAECVVPYSDLWDANEGIGLPYVPLDFPDCNAYSNAMAMEAVETNQKAKPSSSF
ncbi:hypothetical protein PHJA_001499000 [Phtheirospermum japonicum]|uniref:Uncharacterized protein n=1 Tax=Phtheirospermum japonicum TaxID=374723 RepID=A0A830C3A2_9LAMI|nr:hypothetical protein PHJA_001499000 [Phtheirospermum japonicum]